MKKLFVLGILTIALQAQTLYVAAAANLSYVMPKLLEVFKTHYPNIAVKVSYASSGKLTAQIQKGAPFAVFLSADTSYPKFLYTKGFALTHPVVYAKGALALYSKKITRLSELPKLSRIAVANPKTAPYGKAAKEALQNAGLYDKLKSKFIYGQSIGQTTAYAIKAAEAGLVAKSAMYAPKMAKLRSYFHDIDPKLYTPIAQAMVLLKNSDAARTFFVFILSRDAAKIFEKYGYVIDD